jgi:predicted small secreted protein
MGRLRKVIVWSWLALCLGGVVLTGCHTIHGAGEDIQGAGRSMERATE